MSEEKDLGSLAATEDVSAGSSAPDAAPHDVKHTPGPWVTTRHVLNFGRVITREAHAGRPFGGSVDAERNRATYMSAIAHVPETGGDHYPKAEGVANAQLIAAAPEMLALLKDLISPVGGFYASTENYKRVQAAIRKAEGR